MSADALSVPRRSPLPSRSTAALAAVAFGVALWAAGSALVQWSRVRGALRSPVYQEPTATGAAQAAAPPAPTMPTRRVLLVGDSAALGVGAEGPHQSLAGLISADDPRMRVLNLARSGATLADVRTQLHAAGAGFDVAVIVAGGNDILRGRRMDRIAADAESAMAMLGERAARVVWLGVANMGLAPLFVPPWSWWVSARTRRASRLLCRAALRHGVCYVDFFKEAREDVFSSDPARYFAADGIHPSSSAYRYCYEVLRKELG